RPITTITLNHPIQIDAGSGNDTVFGSDFGIGDKISGGAGNDTLHGRGGSDDIGGISAFCLTGCECLEHLAGGTPIDECFGDAGTDNVTCALTAEGNGDLNDTCRFDEDSGSTDFDCDNPHPTPFPCPP